MIPRESLISQFNCKFVVYRFKGCIDGLRMIYKKGPCGPFFFLYQVSYLGLRLGQKAFPRAFFNGDIILSMESPHRFPT